ncbi:MAG TPA: phytanoyl-CoA dioxygenase family protein [Terriglobales bacterium]|nr:phytanoyl-CoA dioxygenase family protein [Terriglobales bacterium]
MIWHKQLEEQGFAIFPEMLAQAELQQLLEGLDQPTLRRSRAGVRHALGHSPVAALASDPRLLGIVQEVLGKDAFPFRATLFNKSPLTNWLVIWHQDTALPLRERKELSAWGPWSVKEGVIYAHAPASALGQVLALRIHLDDSTAHNGPLRVLPGTHKLGVLSDDVIHKLTTEVPAVDCLVPEGGVLAMRPLLVHASSKSQAQFPRRVLHIEFAASVIIAEGLELAVA